jgi:ribosome biogenesis protein MAK21
LSGPSPATDDEPYDPLKRDPQFAHASSSPLHELYPLVTHYHPTVCLYAKHLLVSESLPASASPDLSLNTLGHFLDRFVYKNPKQRKNQNGEGEEDSGKIKGGSAMQPAASAVDGVKLVKGVGSMEERVNEERWWKRNVEDVSVDQVRYLSDRSLNFP